MRSMLFSVQCHINSVTTNLPLERILHCEGSDTAVELKKKPPKRTAMIPNKNDNKHDIIRKKKAMNPKRIISIPKPPLLLPSLPGTSSSKTPPPPPAGNGVWSMCLFQRNSIPMAGIEVRRPILGFFYNWIVPEMAETRWVTGDGLVLFVLIWGEITTKSVNQIKSDNKKWYYSFSVENIKSLNSLHIAQLLKSEEMCKL